MVRSLVCVAFILLFFACGEPSGELTLFSQMSAQDTGIEFSNNLQRDSKFDIFSY